MNQKLVSLAIQCINESRAVSLAKLFAQFPEVAVCDVLYGQTGLTDTVRPIWYVYPFIFELLPQAIPIIFEHAKKNDQLHDLVCSIPMNRPTCIPIMSHLLSLGMNPNLFVHHFFKSDSIRVMNMLLDAGIDFSFLSKPLSEMDEREQNLHRFLEMSGGLCCFLKNFPNVFCENFVKRMIKAGYPISIGNPMGRIIGNKSFSDSFEVVKIFVHAGYPITDNDMENARKYYSDEQIAELDSIRLDSIIKDAIKNDASKDVEEEQATSSRRRKIDL